MSTSDIIRALTEREVTSVVVLGDGQRANFVGSKFVQHFKCPLFLVSQGESRYLPGECGGAEVWAQALSPQLFGQIMEPRELDYAILVSVGAPWIVPSDVLALFPSRAFNLHPGSLPSNRGASAVSWSIMNREEQPRFTLHALTPQIDDGEVIVEQILETSSRVPNVEEARGQHDIALARVLESFFRLVDGFDVEDAVRVPDADRAYFPALSAERHGWVNWEWDGADIESFIRSFSRPYPGASTFHGQRRIRIFDAEFSASQAKRHPFAHGIVVDKMSGALVVCVRGGQLIIRGEDLAGVATNFITIGDRLFTPVEHLEEAKKFRRRHLAPPDTAG